MRTMYDSVSAGGVPGAAMLIACYEDGLYANVAAMRARFPNATLVPIAVRASHNSSTVKVLDVETGDATPAEAPGWVSRQRALGGGDTVYCNSSTWPAVRDAFKAQGVAPGPFWIAQYDNVPSIPASWAALGCIAKQYADPGPYDLSVVADFWPGVDLTPPGGIVLDDPTAQQIKQLVHDAVFLAPITDLNEPDGRGGFHTETLFHQLQYLQLNAANQMKGTNAVATAVASLGTAVASVAAAVAKLGTSDAQVLAGLQAAESALAGIPAQVEAALKDGVVHVDVSVAGPPPSAPAAP